MAFQSVPDGVEIVFHASQNGVPIVNVYHIKDTTTPSTVRLQAIIDAFKAWWDTFISPALSDSYVLGDITATALTLSTGPQVVQAYATANSGLAHGAQAAGNAALVISWRTASIGRSFRGRTYIGGMAQADLLDAQFATVGMVDAMTTAGVALIDAMTAIGAVLCVLSRVSLLVHRVTGLLTEVISVLVDQKIDSQRKRTAN